MSTDHGDTLCPRCGEYVRRWHDCEHGPIDTWGEVELLLDPTLIDIFMVNGMNTTAIQPSGRLIATGICRIPD